jgi:hypothetical protein
MAVGETLFTFTAYHNQPAPAAGCGFGSRNGTPVLTFDQTTQEAAIFGAIMPQHYAGGGVAVFLHWAGASSTGTVGWDVALERIGDNQQDIDGDSFATAAAIAPVAAPTTVGNVDIGTVSFGGGAPMDGILAGEYFRVRVRRDVAADTLNNDAHLLAVELREI